MPDSDNRRPRRTLPEEGFTPNPRAPFVELGVTSCFSFLRGASDAVDLAATAWAQGYDAIGIADLNTMAGVVRIHAEARKACLRPVIGCRLQLQTGRDISGLSARPRRLWPALHAAVEGQDAGCGRELAGQGRLRHNLRDLAAHAEDVQLIVVPGEDPDAVCRRPAALDPHIADPAPYRGQLSVSRR